MSEMDSVFGLLVGWDPLDFWFLRWIPDVFMVDFELNRCRHQNLLVLIRFQHEGVCEA
jgi:hypothetical protein